MTAEERARAIVEHHMGHCEDAGSLYATAITLAIAVERDAFRRGAEAMRELAATEADDSYLCCEDSTIHHVIAKAIRSLPLPEVT